MKLANFSRDQTDPFSFGNKVLLDMTLKKQADATETRYWCSVLRKRDFPVEELQELHRKGQITLMSQLVKMGRFNLYDKILAKYNTETDDSLELKK